jgi:hypothetical protein
VLNEEFLELVPLELPAQLQYEPVLLLPGLVPRVDALEDALHDIDLGALFQGLDVLAKVEGPTELAQKGGQVLGRRS